MSEDSSTAARFRHLGKKEATQPLAVELLKCEAQVMTQRILSFTAAILMAVVVLQAQQTNEAFSTFEKAVKEEPAGFAGDKSRLSAVFAAERRRLGNRFEPELLKWIGSDPEKHYWISFFLEAESYLHGDKPLPHLSLLIKQQGLALVQDKDDEESRGYVVGLSVTAAILSSELGFPALASSYKNQAESLLVRYPTLSVFVPASSDEDRRTYDGIKSVFTRNTPTVISDSNPAPKAQISGGILNGKAIKMGKPVWPPAAHAAGASGTVQVRIVFDEAGNVIWAQAFSGHPMLRSTCEDAAWQTKFKPVTLSGKPVKVAGTLQYNFVP